jgi:hypothetical protein
MSRSVAEDRRFGRTADRIDLAVHRKERPPHRILDAVRRARLSRS